MSDFMMEQWIYVARLIGAAVCGGLIGYERQSRKKTAGVRTHVIISVAAATMMIISKYGFNDVLGEYVRLDPSRVAAGIVTAVGFIGSGIIFFRNNNVSGIPHLPQACGLRWEWAWPWAAACMCWAWYLQLL